jgi:hypothetical protein
LKAKQGCGDGWSGCISTRLYQINKTFSAGRNQEEMFQVLKNVLNTPIIAAAQSAVSSQLGVPATQPESKSPTAPRTVHLSASERLYKSLESEEEQPQQRSKNNDDFTKKANKRKSRLGTTKYLAPKEEISDADKELVFKDGYLFWMSPNKKPIGKV